MSGRLCLEGQHHTKAAIWSGGLKVREKLLQELSWFVRAVAKVPGVRKIGLLGSITTEKKNPKDIDFVVVVEDTADLEPLARWGRKLSGHAMQVGRGADVFLANTRGTYIGRTCHWRDCGPGLRASCDALNCGQRHYLHDDLETIRLKDAIVQEAMELWPQLEKRSGLPSDLESVLRELEE